MLQKAKSTLLKVLICVCLVCCLVAMFVAVTACNKTEAPTVVGGHVDTNGHLILELSDGSTSDAGLVAQPGTPGTNGTNGANGVGIKNVTINDDGDLVITLDNDKEIVVEIPDYSVNCVDGEEHVWVDLHKVVDANCISGETWLTVCRRPGCNAMYLSQKGDPNPDNHLNLVDADTKPTCTKAGNTDQICKDCGKTIKGQEVAALGHTPYIKTADKTAWRAEDSSVEKTGWVKEVTDLPEGVAENWVPVVDDLSVFCVDGGEVALVCADCHEEIKESEHRDAPGHLITGEWTITQRPTDDATGLAEGLCARCGETTIVLPKLTAKDAEGHLLWTSKTENGVCKEGADNTVAKTIYTYVYKYLDESKEPAEQEKKFSFEVLGDVKHTYNGEAIYQTGEISGDSPVYDDITDADVAAGTVEKAFEHFGNSSNTCSKVGYAMFTCEVCGERILIRVRGTNHNPDYNQKLSEVPATCTERGYTEYVCKNSTDGHTYKEYTKALGHSWKVDNTKSTFDESAGTADLYVYCDRDGCDATDHIVGTNVKKTETPAKCEEAGKIVWTYQYQPEGAEKPLEGKFEETVDALFHALIHNDNTFEFKNGLPDDGTVTYEIEDIAKGLGLSVQELLSTYDDFNKFANSHPDCKNPGWVYIDCSRCKQKILIRLVGEHDWDPDSAYDVKGTCKADAEHPDGVAPADGYTCSVCGKHTTKPKDGQGIPDHTWEVKVDEKTNKVNCTCTVCGKQAEGKLDTSKGDGNTGIEKKAATCAPGDAGKGYTKYYYLDASNKPGVATVWTDRLTTHCFGLDGDATYLTGITEDPDVCQSDSLTAGKFLAAAQKGGEIVDPSFANSHPTCKKEGKITIKCSVCNEQLVLTVKGDHTLGKEELKAPTCTTAGYTYQKCSECNQEVKKPGSDKAALGHDLTIVVETEPTVDQAGSAKVSCSRCSVGGTVELPKLSDTTFWKRTEKASSCTVPGSDTYTHEFNYDGTKESISVVVARVLTDHELEEKLLDWYSEDTLTHYWGHLCKKCGQLIVDHKEKLDKLTDPEEGEYLLTFFQAARNDGKGERCYFTDEVKNTYFFASTTDVTKAVKVTLTKSGEDGWVIKVGEKYLELVVSDTHVNIKLNDAQTEGAVWKWNAEHGIFTFVASGTEGYIGTYGTYDTFSASALENYATGSYFAVLATLAEDAAE